MRNWIDLITESFVDPGQQRAHALIKQFGGSPKPFSALPPAAKKAVKHYMTVDGENDEYQTNLLYAYAEIPTDVFMHAYWENIIDLYPEVREDYETAEEMLQKYRSGHPSKSAGFKGYNFKKHDLKNPWPVMLGTEFFEDGAHRLALYVYSGLTKIPAVSFYNSEKTDA